MLIIFPFTLDIFLWLKIINIEFFFKIYMVQLLLIFFFFLFLIFFNNVDLCLTLMILTLTIDNNHWPFYLNLLFPWKIFLFLPTTHGYMHLKFIEVNNFNIIRLQSLRYQLNFGLLVPLWPWHSWIWNWIWIKVCSFLIYQ